MSLHELIEWAVGWFRAQAGWLVPIAFIALVYAAWPLLSPEERKLRRQRARRDARDRAELLAQRNEVRDLLTAKRNQGPPGR